MITKDYEAHKAMRESNPNLPKYDQHTSDKNEVIEAEKEAAKSKSKSE